MTITTEQAEANTSEYLGRDIKTANNDLKFLNNDFAFAIFNENLAQAIKNRIQTTTAELRSYTYYGSDLPDIVNQSNNSTSINKIKRAIQGSLMQEPRIDEVEKLQVEYKNGIYTVNLQVLPINTVDNMNLIFDLFE